MIYYFLKAFDIIFGLRYKYFIETKIILMEEENNYENLYLRLEKLINECEKIDINKIRNKFNSDFNSLAIHIFLNLEKNTFQVKRENEKYIKKIDKILREKYLKKYQLDILPFRFLELKHKLNYLPDNNNIVYFSRLSFYKKNKQVITNRKTINNLKQLICILRYD